MKAPFSSKACLTVSLSLLSVLAAGVRGEEGPPATHSAGQVIDGLAQYFDRLGRLPALEVEYRMDYDEFIHNSSESWAWKWAEFVNVIRPGDPGKVYVRNHHPKHATGPRGEEIHEDLVFSLDGPLEVSVESSDEEGTTYPAAAVVTTVKKHRLTRLSIFCYYFRYLGYPVSEEPEAGLPPRMHYPEDSYWLPAALTKNRDHYRVGERLEKVGEVWCHVLERPGVDKLWVQMEPSVVIRGRQVYWAETKSVRQILAYEDFQEVAPEVSLPRSIIFDFYATPWDDAAIQNKVVYRHRIRVSKLSAEAVPDSRFRAEIPVGANVYDCVSTGPDTKQGISYTNRPGMDPFERALAALEPKPNARRFSAWEVGVTMGTVILVIGLLLVFRRRRAAGG